MSYVKKALARLGRLKLAQVLGTLIVLSGAALRLRQYFVNRSLWVDEASLALNIVERSFSSLFLPLDYDQGAPLGFLFIEKLLVSVFGNEDFILRLFPLFSGILALLLIHRIALNALGSFGLFSALLFSASHTMIYYSSELKQYSSDAMIGLLLVYLASLCMAEGARLRNIILLGFAGFISILVSHPSIFFLPAIGFLLVIQNWMERDFRKVRWLIGAGISWILVFLSTYLISLQYLAGNEYLQEYWGGHYAPLPPWEHLDWYRRVALYLVPPVAPSYFPLLNLNLDQEILISSCLILFLTGILSLIKRNIKLAALMLLPILLTFVASVLNRYPMGDRFLLFWFPFFLLFFGEGLRSIYTMTSRYSPRSGALIYGVLSITMLWTPLSAAIENAANPPMGEDIKPVLAYIQDHKEEKDIIYIHNGSVTPYLFYAPSYVFDDEYVFVAEKSWNIKRFTIDVVELRGNDRVWFVFSHVVFCDCDGDRVQAHLRIIEEYGERIDGFEAARAAAYLYDMDP
ncbi:MAG: hypothetical protein DYG86_07855 [Chloroflexi bacterium CFX2]|nr:hypothetical protein [Chloroflexi bacterium CFX2]